MSSTGSVGSRQPDGTVEGPACSFKVSDRFNILIINILCNNPERIQPE